MSSPTSERSVSPALLGLLGVLVVAAIGYFVWTTFFQEDLTAPAPTTPVVVATPTPTETPEEPSTLTETFEVFNTRNPFDALVSDTTSTGVPGTVPVPSQSAQAGTTTANPSGTTSSSSGTNAGTNGQTQTNVGKTSIKLVNVDGTKVTVAVNGTEHTASTGETFAQRFRVLTVNEVNDEKCATMLFGDSRFTLCQGDQVTK